VGDFADLQLEKPDAPDAAPRRRGGARLTVGALIVLALVTYGGYLAWLRRSADSPASTPGTPRAAAPVVTRTLPVERAADITVPPIDESDSLVRELVSQLSQHPKVVAWLTTDHLIRNFAVVIQNVGGRESPAQHLRSVRPAGTFAVVRDGAKTYIDPASYRRYDAHADAFAAIDPRGAARLYATVKPRVSEALRDLGGSGADADATLTRAINELLATPVIEGRIPLRQTSVMYAFEDPTLESLSPAQRQLLRTGPRNVRIVQQKLREIAPYAGIDVSAATRR
jgi:hypothetical protein